MTDTELIRTIKAIQIEAVEVAMMAKALIEKLEQEQSVHPDQLQLVQDESDLAGLA